MRDSLADVEALALRCRAEQAKDYIEEAISCYRAGAFRSTIVSNWIAVVFDLIAKISELALAGDSGAIDLKRIYDAYLAQIDAGNEQGIRGALDFERGLVATCRDRFQFFDHHQMRDLERLREDRNQCAHPSFQRLGEPYRPHAEHARVHLRNAVEHVLSQAPVQGRAAISSLVSVVSSEYFPKRPEQAAAILRATALANPNEALIRGFVDALVFGFATSGSAVEGRLQVGPALAGLLDMQRAVVEPRLRTQLSKLIRDVDDRTFSKVTRLLASSPELLNLVDEPSRIRLRAFVETGPADDVSQVIASLAQLPEIAIAATARILTFDVNILAAAITHGARGLAKEASLRLLAQAGNWNGVNDIFTRVITPLFDLLDRVDVERIIRMPTETRADLPGAGGYARFLSRVRAADLIPADELDALLSANQASFHVRARENDI
jgi:hypothetical protein